MFCLQESVTMEAVTASRWTDDRLDDFRRDVDSRFDRVESRLDRVETRLDGIQNSIVDLHRLIGDSNAELRASIGDSNAELRASIGELSTELHGSIAGLHKTMSQFAMMLVVALVGLTATQLGLILTQL
jgi:chromosome segregation ATPase